MKKFMKALFFMAVFVLVFSACSGGDNDTSSPEDVNVTVDADDDSAPEEESTPSPEDEDSDEKTAEESPPPEYEHLPDGVTAEEVGGEFVSIGDTHRIIPDLEAELSREVYSHQDEEGESRYTVVELMLDRTGTTEAPVQISEYYVVDLGGDIVFPSYWQSLDTCWPMNDFKECDKKEATFPSDREGQMEVNLFFEQESKSHDGVWLKFEGGDSFFWVET